MHIPRGIKREIDEKDKKTSKLTDEKQDVDASASKRAKFERTFVPSWLEKYEWLRYDAASNLMYCALCIKYQKSNAFTEGCQNFRRDNLNKHINTNDHRASCRQEKGEQGQRPPSNCSQSSGHSSVHSVHSSVTSAGDTSADSSSSSSSHQLSLNSSDHLSVGSVADQAPPVSVETSNNYVNNRELTPPNVAGQEPLPQTLPHIGHGPPLLPMPVPLFARPPFMFSLHHGPLGIHSIGLVEKVGFTPDTYIAQSLWYLHNLNS